MVIANSKLAQADGEEGRPPALHPVGRLPLPFRLAVAWERRVTRRGAWRLWRAVCRCWGAGRTFDAQLHYGARSRVLLDDPMCRFPLVYGGMVEPSLYAAVRSALRPGDVFVDVGANFGYYTLLAAALVGPTGRVHAFEPQARVAELLRASAQLNGAEHVHVHPVALGDHCGRVLLYAPAGEQSGLATVDAEHLAASRGVQARTVPLRTLDECLSSAAVAVQVMKIDVEGAVLPVLEGARAVLGSDPGPLVFFESGPQSAPAEAAALRGWGYELFHLRHGRLAPFSQGYLLSSAETLCALRPGVHAFPLPPSEPAP